MYIPKRDSSGNVLAPASSPFYSKKVDGGKSVFQRVHGMELSLNGTTNAQAFTFVVPYLECKITGVNVVGAVLGDKLDFNVKDTATGTVSGVPNYKLNQFGFEVFPAADFYKHESGYDADLFAGLQIEVVITPTNTDTRSVYLNLILHELK